MHDATHEQSTLLSSVRIVAKVAIYSEILLAVRKKGSFVGPSGQADIGQECPLAAIRSSIEGHQLRLQKHSQALVRCLEKRLLPRLSMVRWRIYRCPQSRPSYISRRPKVWSLEFAEDINKRPVAGIALVGQVRTSILLLPTSKDGEVFCSGTAGFSSNSSLLSCMIEPT